MNPNPPVGQPTNRRRAAPSSLPIDDAVLFLGSMKDACRKWSAAKRREGFYVRVFHRIVHAGGASIPVVVAVVRARRGSQQEGAHSQTDTLTSPPAPAATEDERPDPLIE